MAIASSSFEGSIFLLVANDNAATLALHANMSLEAPEAEVRDELFSECGAQKGSHLKSTFPQSQT